VTRTQPFLTVLFRCNRQFQCVRPTCRNALATWSVCRTMAFVAGVTTLLGGGGGQLPKHCIHLTHTHTHTVAAAAVMLLNAAAAVDSIRIATRPIK